MKQAAVILALVCAVGCPSAGRAAARPPAPPAPAAADSVAVKPSRWGPLPAPADSNTALFADRPRPGWEKGLLVPYHILGIPFRILGFVGDQTLIGLDKLGIFNVPPADYPGLPGPWGTYIMPAFSIESLEGTKFGLDITQPRMFGGDNKLFLTGDISTRNAYKVAGGMHLNRHERRNFQFGGGGEVIPSVRYYGLGYDSRKGDVSYYHRGAAWGGAELAGPLGGIFDYRTRLFFSRVVTKDSKYDPARTIEEVHGQDVPPGYPGESSGWTLRFGAGYDTTTEKARPQGGWDAEASAALFMASDGSRQQHLTLRASAQTFVPLWHTERTLALRGFYSRLRSLNGGPVPFGRLVTFSSPDELRGFQTLRYYGMGALGVNIEYRWPIWISRNRNGPGLDAYGFSDIGQVYMETHEIALRNLEPTGGVGLRLLGDHGRFLARVEVGFSDEEPIFRFKFSQNFQYDRKVFVDGKDPTRYR